MPLFQQYPLPCQLPEQLPEQSSVPEQIPIRDGELSYIPGFVNEDSQMALFERLKQTLAWQQDEIKVYGRVHPIPRLQAWYGDKEALYRYSGMLMTPNTWTDELQVLRQQVSVACQSEFNSVLANYYRDGMDKMGYHSDNEKALGQRPVIASLSLGCPRKFVLKHHLYDNLGDDKGGQKDGDKIELQLAGGSLLVMKGDTQHYWKHAVPQQKRITQGRINLTFRYTMPV